MRADYGQLPDLDKDRLVRTTCCSPGTAPPRGVRVPNGDWIPADREGLAFADATSAVLRL